MTTARQTPVGFKLEDGFSTKIAFEGDPDISFWEKTVQPPGVDGGDAIDHTTMHNVNWRTMSPRQLKTLTEFTCNVSYDARVYTQIVAQINVNQEITIHFPDASTLVFYGFLKMFEPGELVEGEPPEATITIVPTNYNPQSGNEVAPVLTEGGT